MEKTPQGYIDLLKPEDLLDFFLQHHGDVKVPDQTYEKGLPPQPGVPCPKCTYRNLGGQAYEISETPIGHGIIVFKAFNTANGPAILSYLVDGTHRAVAALRAGRDFFAYVLTPEEALQCMSHIDGKPNPHFIGQQGGVLWDGRGSFIPLPR